MDNTIRIQISQARGEGGGGDDGWGEGDKDYFVTRDCCDSNSIRANISQENFI